MIANIWQRFRPRGASGPKTVVLHVGAGKTGTSAIQTWLARNHGRLAKQGILYPEPPEGFALAMEGKITTGNATPVVEFTNRKRRSAGFNEAAFLAWLDGLLRLRADTILFSSEILPGGDAQLFAALRDFVEERNARVKVVYAVRNAADHAFSKWGQMVKRHGCVLTWDEFCRDSTVPFLRVLNRFADVFGREAIEVINYERHKHDMVGRLLSVVTPLDVGDTRVGTVNRSLSVREVELMRAFNAEVARRTGDAVLRDRLSTELSDHLIYAADLPPMRLSLTEEQFGWLNRTLGRTVRVLNRRYLPDEPVAVADRALVKGPVETVELAPADLALMRDLAGLAAGGSVRIGTLTSGGDGLQAIARAVREARAAVGT